MYVHINNIKGIFPKLIEMGSLYFRDYIVNYKRDRYES